MSTEGTFPFDPSVLKQEEKFWLISIHVSFNVQKYLHKMFITPCQSTRQVFEGNPFDWLNIGQRPIKTTQRSTFDCSKVKVKPPASRRVVIRTPGAPTNRHDATRRGLASNTIEGRFESSSAESVIAATLQLLENSPLICICGYYVDRPPNRQRSLSPIANA